MSVIILKKGEKKATHHRKLSGLKNQLKVLDAYKYLGKIQWPDDPLQYQKRIRNDWGW